MTAIDNYLNKIEPLQRKELERIRNIVKEISPDSVEVISYGIPAFMINDKPLVYFAVFKNHMSLFPTSKPINVLQDRLKEYKISKGAIQFTLEMPLPKQLILDLLSIRLKDIKAS